MSLDALIGEWDVEFKVDTIRGTWEWKRDGRWEKDFDLAYRRSVAP
jgi:hypothetical protein